MNKPVHIAAAGMIIVVFFSCPEKATNPGTQVGPVFSYNSSKCLTGLPKRGPADSVFVYTFTDTLSIDFSVEANCCPDSGRFVVSNRAGNDTLFITIVDTAEYVCRCICLYFIHAEIANLTGDHYVVKCHFIREKPLILSRDPIYLVDVFRSR